MLEDYFRQYGLIAIYMIAAISVPVGMILGSWALSYLKIRPTLPTPVKRSIYECGFETIAGTWNRFNFRFYGLALIFVIFDVEVVFMYPWAVTYGVMSVQFGMFALFEMVVFVGILMVGWLYAWRKGALEWS